jgi:hypothetical protein
MLTKSDATLIVHALLAISPSGGGSPAHTLALTLARECRVEIDDGQVFAMQQTARDELNEG